MGRWLGVDFGTSNTSAAALIDGQVRLIPLEPGRESVPTAVFLDFAARRMLFGSDAAQALAEGREGRFLRALKRVLGTPLMREPRQLLNRRMTLIDLVAMILSRVKERSEATTGLPFDSVVAGRPVHFHADPALDAQAEIDLAEAYRIAGFSRLRWLAEPEAAALACGVTRGLGLVVDIGGGTSDFTLFRADGAPRAIASSGVRLGGTDADRILSLAHVMPCLGLGSSLRAEIGEALHPAPVAPFIDLATWEKIGFLHSPAMRRDTARMARLAVQPELFQRLGEVLEHELGFDLAFAVEAGKIAANAGQGTIDLRMVEPGLGAPLDAAQLDRDLGEFAATVADGARTVLEQTGTAPEQVTHLIYVGGSSLLGAVRRRMETLCPAAEPVETAAFTAVAQGLAVHAG